MFKGFVLTAFAALLFCSFTAVSSYAADDDEEYSYGKNYPMSLGPYLMFKGGVNANDVPQGTKNGFTFNGMPDLGITGYLPFDKDSKLGLTADLGYNTYAYELKSTGNESNPWQEKYSYVVLSPNIHLYGFILGFTFGLPVSATSVYKETSTDINTDRLATMVDIHVGGMIPLLESQTGRFNIVIQGGYFLTGLYDESNMAESEKVYNRHPAHVELGLNYLFNLNAK